MISALYRSRSTLYINKTLLNHPYNSIKSCRILAIKSVNLPVALSHIQARITDRTGNRDRKGDEKDRGEEGGGKRYCASERLNSTLRVAAIYSEATG